jgi:carbonic anhydrase
LSTRTSLRLAPRELTFDVKPLRRVLSGKLEGEEGHANISFTRGPFVTWRRRRARLIKLHAHRGSEHDLDGEQARGEIHLIHRFEPPDPLTRSSLLVVGVVLKAVGNPNESDFVERRQGRRVAIDLTALFPKRRPDWFHYEGSLTTEPYSETVSWIVLRDAVVVDKDFYERLPEQHERKTQPLDRRFVLRNF